MADIEELKLLVARMATENAKLVAALANQPRAGGAPVNAAAVRSEKLAKLSLALRKSGKIKDFKDTEDSNVREWLKRFDQELLSLKKMCGIDDDLQRSEVIDCLRDKLDYSVVRRLDTAFQSKDPVLTWEAVTKAELQAVLMEEYSSKETDVSAVLLQLGPN